MTRFLLRVALTACFAFALAGCGTPFAIPSATEAGSGPEAGTRTGTPAALSTAEPGTPRLLRLWLPSDFDPDAETASARILKARLDLFASVHPEIMLDIRVKDRTGPARLLEMLALARAAAPESLPDLVALPREDVEDAALKGIIHPIDGLTAVLDDPGWYSYSRQLGHVQNSAYGLPFAGDALVLAYDPTRYATPPQDWNAILKRPGALALTGDTPHVLFLISLYRSMNGGLLDEQNHPLLEAFALQPTLEIVERARINRSLFVSSEEAAWQELLAGRAAWTVTTVTRVLADPSERFQVIPLPGLNSDPFTLATSWTWVLAGADPQNEPLAIELADWLVQDEFLNAWVNAAGYLPTRSADANERFPALSVVAESAQPVPSNDLLAALEPVLQAAASRILGGEAVETVVQDAIDALQ